MKKNLSNSLFYNEEAAVSVRNLETNAEQGLSSSEAAGRLNEIGPNRLEGGKEKSIMAMIFEQLKDFLVIILIVAAIISMVASGHLLDGMIILAIVVINTILGVRSEEQSE